MFFFLPMPEGIQQTNRRLTVPDIELCVAIWSGPGGCHRTPVVNRVATTIPNSCFPKPSSNLLGCDAVQGPQLR